MYFFVISAWQFDWFNHKNGNEEPLRAGLRLQRLITDANVEELRTEGLHDFIDQLQFEFANLHQQISSTWFSLELDKAV